MNKKQILEEISKAEEHLASMKKMLAKCEYKRWKPEDGDVYYYIKSSDGEVWRNTFCHTSNSDNIHYNTYNCFQTREQAESEVEKILVRRQLEEIARRLNKGEKIDWSNTGQNKYLLGIKAPYNVIGWDTEYGYKKQGVVYCLDITFCKVATQEIGEERLVKYLKGGWE